MMIVDKEEEINTRVFESVWNSCFQKLPALWAEMCLIIAVYQDVIMSCMLYIWK
jgi:hypothetical protein